MKTIISFNMLVLLSLSIYSQAIDISIVNSEVQQNESGNNYIFMVDSISFEMVFVQGGSFIMGDDSSKAKKYSVTLTDYYIGQFEVTQALWKAVMGSNPSSFKGDNLPVECVSWVDCMKFIDKLNQLTGRTFSLPTEAQWEFAARGGNHSKGYEYSGSSHVRDVAWYYENSGDKFLNDENWDANRLFSNNCSTHAVRTKLANELGIYDMSGNVWEWCSDWYGDYGTDSQTNPKGPGIGSYRVNRGGSWRNPARSCRVFLRDSYIPDYRGNDLGLRLVLTQ